MAGEDFDRELEDLPPELRWREWMGRIEAVLFASASPIGGEDLARVVGQGASVEMLINDIKTELVGRPYELARVAGSAPGRGVIPTLARAEWSLARSSGEVRAGCWAAMDVLR